MEPISFESRIRTENTARRFFTNLCWKNYHRFCSRCRCYEIYRIDGKKFGCKRFKYTFHDFTGRWINKLRNRCRNWHWIIKFFELGLPARKISQQVGLSYPTVLKVLNILRMAIIANNTDSDDLLTGEIELDEANFGGRRNGNRGRGVAGKVPVFGILERDGIVRVEVVKDVSAMTLLNLKIKTVHRGSIVYMDKFRSYDALMCCGYRHLKIDHHKKFSNGKVYINGLEVFWSYAKERLIKHHGVSKAKFPLYSNTTYYAKKYIRENPLRPVLFHGSSRFQCLDISQAKSAENDEISLHKDKIHEKDYRICNSELSKNLMGS